MAIDAPKYKLCIAIYGAGVGCALLSHALKDHTHLDVHYFLPTDDPRLPSISTLDFDDKGRDGLALVGGSASKALDRAQGHTQKQGEAVLSHDADASAVVLDSARVSTPPNTNATRSITSVHATAFVNEILRLANPKNIHKHKKLVSVQHSNSARTPLALRFADDTVVNVDVLVGDDGAEGTMRTQILGGEHWTSKPIHTGYASVHIDFGDYDNGQSSPRIAQYIGDGASILVTSSSCQIIMHIRDDPSLNSGTSYILDDLKLRIPALRTDPALCEAISRQSGLGLTPLLVHSHAPTFINGLLAMAGSSAQTMPNLPYPYLSTGEHISDALILDSLLGEARDHDGLEAALYAYDSVRRYRSQWVSDHATKVLELSCGVMDGVGLDAAAVPRELAKRIEALDAVNIMEERRSALRVMRERLWMAGKVESMGEDEE